MQEYELLQQVTTDSGYQLSFWTPKQSDVSVSDVARDIYRAIGEFVIREQQGYDD